MDVMLTKKKLFSSGVIASKTIGNMRFTVRGTRRVFSFAKYDVTFDPLPLNFGKVSLSIASGDFKTVYRELKKHDEAKSGTGLLREVARAISDPGVKSTNFFTIDELEILALLKIRPRSVSGLQYMTSPGLKGDLTALFKLRELGLVKRSDGEPDDVYTLTENGNEVHGWLMEERSFQRLQSSFGIA